MIALRRMFVREYSAGVLKLSFVIVSSAPFVINVLIISIAVESGTEVESGEPVKCRAVFLL